MAGKGERWDRKPLRIGALQWESPKDESDAVLDAWQAGGFNTEQLLHVIGEDFYCFYNPELHKERLTRYITRAHQKGIMIIGYINVSNLPSTYGDRVSECAQRGWNRGTEDADANVEESAGAIFGKPSCVNTPFRDLTFEAIRGMMECGADGVFMDGPHFLGDGCYCRFCREQFIARYGQEMPGPGGSLEQWRNFKQFRIDSLTSFVRGASESVKSVKSDGVLYLNHFIYSPSSDSGHCTRDLMGVMDWLGSEGGFQFYGYPQSVQLWKTAAYAKLQEAIAPDKPRVIFIAGNNCPSHYNIHTPVETELMIGGSVANGAGFWYGTHHGPSDLEQPGGKKAVELTRKLRDLEEYLLPGSSLADIALLWSHSTREAFDGFLKTDEAPLFDIPLSTDKGIEIPGLPIPGIDQLQSFESAYDMLGHSRLCFDVLHDHFLSAEKLARYKLVILPDSACMDDTQAELIRDYVAKGGNIIAFHATSLFRPDGTKREDFALADVFGVEFGGTMSDYNYRGAFKVDLSHVMFGHMTREESCCPRFALDCRETTAGTPAMYFEPISQAYEALPSLSRAAVFENRFGAGTCYYIPGKMCEQYRHYGTPEFLGMIQNLIGVLSPDPPVVVDAESEVVGVSLREQKQAGRSILYLLNYTGSQKRPIRKSVPLVNVDIRVKTQADSARSLLADRALACARDGDYLCLVLPRLDTFEMICME